MADKKSYHVKIKSAFDQINENQSNTRTDKYVGKTQFKIGKEFRRVEVGDPKEYLDTALEAEKYVSTFQVEEKDGIYWSGYMGDKTPLGFPLGASGITYFYLELYKATKDEKFKETVLKACDYLDKHWKESLEAARNATGFRGPFGIFHDIVGIGKTLLVVYKNFGREKDKIALTAIADEIVANMKEDENGAFWDGDPVFSHDASITVFLFRVSEALHREDYKSAAKKASYTVLAAGVADERGGTSWDTKMDLFPCKVPNFEMGTAGTGFALAVAYEYTQDERFLQGAKEAEKYLKSITVPKGKGFLIPFRDEPDTEQIFYVAECNGPTGTSKFFYQLYKVTKDESYLQDIKGLFDGLRGIGAPEKQSAGYWNTTCTCCGTAGILQFALNLFHVLPEKEILDVAKTAASIVLAEQEKQDLGTAWPHAWTRITPDFITVDPGFVNGASGIATALLEIYSVSGEHFEVDRLMEDPFPMSMESMV